MAAGEAPTANLMGRPNYRKPLFSYLSPDNRLVVPSSSGVTPLNQPAQDALNVLWRREKLLRLIGEAVKKNFSTNLVLLNHTHAALELGLSSEVTPEYPDAKGLLDRYKRLEKWKKSKFEPIQESGHGIRAMVRLLLGILHPTVDTVFIDEPELHLYPRHKRNLGKSLVRLAKEEDRQVFIVTHDASILQGVLDASKDATIFRLSAPTLTTRKIRRCKLGDAAEIGPTKNQKEYLHVLFYERVVVVEGSTDRTFYEGVRDLYALREEEDIGFVVSGGKGAAVNVSALAKATGVPHIVLGDFDLLFEKEILAKLNELRPEPADLGGLDDLVKAAQASTSKTSLKQKGLEVEGLPSTTRSGIQGYLKKLQAAGIWIVPSGELESWAPSIGKDARFAELALDRIRHDKSKGEAASKFLDDAFASALKQPLG